MGLAGWKLQRDQIPHCGVNPQKRTAREQHILANCKTYDYIGLHGTNATGPNSRKRAKNRHYSPSAVKGLQAAI
jgi:hypothetical protein